MDHLEGHLVDQLEGREDFFWHRGRWDAIKSLLGKRGAFDLLDVGAGPGFAGGYLKKDFPAARYFFCETMPSMEAHLRARFGADRNLKDRDISGVDVVLMMDVLEHQADDKKFLAQWLERMRPGAELIGTVPAMPVLWSEWDKMLGHHRRYKKRDFLPLVKDLPVKLESVSYMFPEMVLPGLGRKIFASGSATQSPAEFPHLPPFVNKLAILFHSTVAPWQFLLPFGSSLIFKMRRQ